MKFLLVQALVVALVYTNVFAIQPVNLMGPGLKVQVEGDGSNGASSGFSSGGSFKSSSSFSSGNGGGSSSSSSFKSSSSSSSGGGLSSGLLSGGGHGKMKVIRHTFSTGGVTAESWAAFFTKYAQQITTFVTSKNFQGLGAFFVKMAAELPVQPCHNGKASLVSVIRSCGMNDQDLKKAIELNQQGKTGSDGFWYLIVRSNGKDEKDSETQYKKVIQIVNQNQDKVREAASSGNFKLLIQLLTR
jgi:hypothetical protein